MIKKNKFIYKIVLLISSLLSSCRWNTKWFQLNCSWKNDEYCFTIYDECCFADFTYNNISFHLGCSLSNNGTYIEFHYIYEDTSQHLTDNDYVMKANANYERQTLYLTFTKDQIIDLQGKTREFHQIVI
mgnify:FL=1